LAEAATSASVCQLLNATSAAENEGPERIKRSGDRRQGVKDIGATNYADADTLVAA